MRIVFVNPPFLDWSRNLPLGLAYIAAYLREAGYNDIKALDASNEGLNVDETAERIISMKPDVLAVTSSTPQIKNAWRTIEKVKKTNPETKTVLGGFHPSSLPDESLGTGFVDFVVRGEGEQTMLELVNALENKGKFDAIKGISYKKGGRIMHNADRQLIQDLDKLPFPARDLFPFPEKYSSPFLIRKIYATLSTSRGCPGACNFCNKKIFGFCFRARSPENVLAEIEFLVEKYGVEEFHFVEDAFSTDPERVRKICNLIIEKKLDIAWAFPNGIRVDSVNLNLLKLMRKAGCYRVAFGVESGSEDVLKKIGKNISLSQVKKAFFDAQKAGMITLAFFMLGHWGDTEETMKQTIDFAKELKTDYANFTMTTPFPGTVLYKLVEKYGRFLTNDWEKFGYFTHPVFEFDSLPKESVEKMYTKSYREFYFRPSQIFFILKKRLRYLSLRDLKQLKNGFLYLISRKAQN